MGNDLRDYRVAYMTWYLELYFIWLLLIFSLPNNNHWTPPAIFDCITVVLAHHAIICVFPIGRHTVAIDNPQGPTYLAVTPLNSNILQIVEEFLPLIHYRVAWVACHRSNPWPIWAQDALVLGPRGGKGEREPGWAFPCNTLCFCVYAMHATFSLLLLYRHNRIQ